VELSGNSSAATRLTGAKVKRKLCLFGSVYYAVGVARDGCNNDGYYGRWDGMAMEDEWNWLRSMSGAWQWIAQTQGSVTIAALQYLYYFKISYFLNDNWRINYMFVSVFETRRKVSLIVSQLIMMT
jgi:hypothetical protein